MKERELIIYENGQLTNEDPNYEIIKSSGVENYLSNIRPTWQAKNLIQRTMKILPVDPSSACQRIFNASVHDLREKIIMAGIDIAQEAAKAYKLPSIINDETILEEYDTSKLIYLAYRMGLLSRPEYRRVSRVYDIRKDLEHEDDEYEAGVEDVVYIFKTCVDVILANDPVQIIKLTEIKEILESPDPVSLDQAVVEDYKQAPIPRQVDIYKFLISTSLDNSQPDIVRQNCFNALGAIKDYTDNKAILEVSKFYIDNKLKRRTPTIAEMRVSNISGILSYLRRASINEFYNNYYNRMHQTGFSWENNSKHGELLRDLKELGGLVYCSDESVKTKILEWLILCYIGEPGGYGPHGRNRRVFYSNSGAPLCYEIIEDDESINSEEIENIKKVSRSIKRLTQDKFVMRRYQDILDIHS